MCRDESLPVAALWAKTDRDNPARWHPLANHLIEVAAVAAEMWDTTLPPLARDRWIAWFGDEDCSRAWLVMLAGLHDLGKASPVFQGASDEQRSRLRDAGAPLRPKPSNPIRHGAITAATLPALLRERWSSLSPPVARRYAVLSGIHHGSLLDATTLQNAKPNRNPDQAGLGVWDGARRKLFDLALTVIGNVPDPPEAPLPYSLATWAAGFISVADWIGSNTSYFPFDTPPGDPARAFEGAKAKARRALSELGWLHGAVDVPVAFDEAFPDWAPNATQQATIDAVNAMDRPGVVIVEAPMGDGKTEAAFWTAAHAQRHWGARGLYVAMPTRASSDQLFDRLANLLTDHASDGEKVNLLLLHGHAAISAQLQQVQRGATVFDPEPAAASPDQPADPLLRSDWFSARRRGLLAPYGVGTVDQTLLGILENRHYFVRLHGLTGKTVVFDEVHAYDTYMETLFVRELEALGALGTPVVILTATLPSERRDALLDAYARGAGWNPTADQHAVPYPRVTTVDQNAIRSVGIVPSGRERTVALRWFTGSEESARAEMADALVEALEDGGACAVICNTVGQAQHMYTVLEDRFPSEVDLFHARFRYMDRAERQDRVLTSFGKNPERRPHRRIVVATQVIEQSLDLDFDLMVTYFCPTDLLLQRLGRMHRHDSNDAQRPDGLKHPQLWVIGVGDTDDKQYPEPGVPYVSRLVYDVHVLLRSWVVLRNRDQLHLPADIEACIEQTYGAAIEPPPDLASAWRLSEATFHRTVTERSLKASAIMAPSLGIDTIAGGTDPLIRNVGEKTAEDEQKQDMAASAIAHTRDGSPSVDVVLLTPDEHDRLNPESGDGRKSLPMRKVAELLARSVGISQQRLYRELMSHDPPRSWQGTVWLRRHRLVRLDHRREVRIGNYTVTLSPALGVVIGKTNE